ncbi:hypothetical protein NDU88_005157 [Pleurodeles waltl]|uniref:Uncharacterized protein n=1 Tax=Pleurodeles waltl TaxID=8319 RepID=A0AAV7TB60_PLEWA|nr:hypothetical protein NDU88_005157 [Pleurodeles waltl]
MSGRLFPVSLAPVPAVWGVVWSALRLRSGCPCRTRTVGVACSRGLPAVALLEGEVPGRCLRCYDARASQGSLWCCRDNDVASETKESSSLGKRRRWVEGPTPWVSPIVIAQKPKQPGEVRICVDMCLPNIAIIPTVDDIVAKVAGSRWFSKMDLRA